MNRMLIAIGCLCMAAPAVGQSIGPAPSPAMCEQILVTAYPSEHDDSRSADQGARRSFSAGQVADLQFAVIIPRRAKLVELYQLRIYTPAGHLYQAMDLPVKGPGQESQAARSLPGYPFPVPAQSPEPTTEGTAGARRITARMPLGGTLVTTNSLYGPWRVEVWPQGSVQPCTGALFHVTP